MDLAPRPPAQPDGVTRRRFLGGALAAVGAGAVLPAWLADAAGAATPLAPTDGALVVVTLAGGNDGLNTLVPRSGTLRGLYEQLRGAIALPVTNLLSATGLLGATGLLVDGGELALHPSLPKLSARFAQGKVAIVQGAGHTTGPDLSHFTSMATLMSGTASGSRATGWLGRFLDDDGDWATGLRGATIGSTVPLHLVGSRAKVMAVPTEGAIWGADPAVWEQWAYDALREMAQAPTGLSTVADRTATTTSDALHVAPTVNGVVLPAPSVRGLAADLTMAARLLNANLGTRVVATSVGGWDTHAVQMKAHADRLADLDTAIDTFFGLLRPEVARQTVVLVLSEFGRRPRINASQGTDHGTAGLALLVGDAVRGGLHGAMPSLTALDTWGNLVPTVDHRSVYATVLDRWLDADATQVLGAGYPQLDLFSRSPAA